MENLGYECTTSLANEKVVDGRPALHTANDTRMSRSRLRLKPASILPSPACKGWVCGWCRCFVVSWGGFQMSETILILTRFLPLSRRNGSQTQGQKTTPTPHRHIDTAALARIRPPSHHKTVFDVSCTLEFMDSIYHGK